MSIYVHRNRINKPMRLHSKAGLAAASARTVAAKTVRGRATTRVWAKSFSVKLFFVELLGQSSWVHSSQLSIIFTTIGWRFAKTSVSWGLVIITWQVRLTHNILRNDIEGIEWHKSLCDWSDDEPLNTPWRNRRTFRFYRLGLAVSECRSQAPKPLASFHPEAWVLGRVWICLDVWPGSRLSKGLWSRLIWMM